MKSCLLPRLLLPLLFACPALAQTPPDPFQSHIQAGQTALRAGLPLVAVREYRAAVRLRPADADAHYALAGVLEAAGWADEAEAEYRQTLALRPDNAPAHNALAGLLDDRGQAAAALGEYREAVALLPADPRLRFNLAAALAETGRRPEAAAQYREALRLQPDFADAAQALRALGLPDHVAVGAPLAAPSSRKRTASHQEGAASGAPTNMQRALALARAGRLPEAIAAFRALLVQDPRDAAARLSLGIALYADGHTALARQEWTQVSIAADPNAAAQARRLLARYP